VFVQRCPTNASYMDKISGIALAVGYAVLMTVNLRQEKHLQGLLALLLGFPPPLPHMRAILLDATPPGGLALQLSGRPEPVRRRRPLAAERGRGEPPGSRQLSHISTKPAWEEIERRAQGNGGDGGKMKSICSNGDEKSCQCRRGKTLC